MEQTINTADALRVLDGLSEAQSHHYFATFALGFSKGATREEAIRKLVARFPNEFKEIIRNERKAGNVGAYVWTVRVDQESREYPINFYQPQDVPLSKAKEIEVTRATKHAIEFKECAS